MKEKEFEDKLEKNLNRIEPGLTLVERQKRVDTGVIDLFCKDKKGNHVVVELKMKPDTNVIAQLAKYNMALIKSGLNKKKLRTILVAPEYSKDVKEACEYFNFEIKGVYKKEIRKRKEEELSKRGMPSKDELISFIKSRELVNLSMIARFYGIYNMTASELVKELVQEKLVIVENLGGAKVVRVK